MRKKAIALLLCVALVACSIAGLTVSAKEVTEEVLQLNVNQIELKVGASQPLETNLQFTEEEAAAQRIIWQSDDNSVATVNSNGVLRAKNPGTTTVTCLLADRKTNALLASDTCEVAVSCANTLVLNTHAIKWPIGRAGSYKPQITGDTSAVQTVWESNNTKVATVNANGKLFAVGKGSTTITCTLVDKETGAAVATDACNVTVYQPVSKITLNTHAIKWPVGRAGSYKPTVFPASADNKALTWKSSNTKVATVNANGKLTAVAPGTATITCTAKDGSGAKDTCKVTVYQPVTKIKLNTNKITWQVGTSGSFKPAVSPGNATNKALTWKSSNTKVATVNANGKLTAVSPGTATITCTAKDGSGKKDTCVITVKAKKYTQDDLFCMAAVIWQEAGALYCSDQLQLMVGNVVMNHVAHPSFPNTVRGVITRPGAYGTMGWTGVSIPTPTDAFMERAIDRCYANAKKILEGTRVLPENVIYQAGFVQGSGVYAYREGVYFCYE